MHFCNYFDYCFVFTGRLKKVVVVVVVVAIVSIGALVTVINVTDKVFPVLNHHAIKAYREVETNLQALSSALDA